MTLFLDHRDAFEFAWTRYLLYSSSSRLSYHPITVDDWQINPDKVKRFQEDMRGWFSKLAKGDVCAVRCFDDAGDAIFLVSHGSYISTVSYWEGKAIAFRSFRPPRTSWSSHHRIQS